MTNLITAKTLADIKIKGVTVDWTRVNGEPVEIRITDADGASIVIQKSNDYSRAMSVLVPEPPKMVTRHVLHGDVGGVEIRKAFEHDYEAANARNAFPSDANLVIDKAEVEVTSEGVVNDDDLPF